MAGSLNHLIAPNGTFTMDLIENLGDAHEALEECFSLIAHLTKGKRKRISRACDATGCVDPYSDRMGGEPRTKGMRAAARRPDAPR